MKRLTISILLVFISLSILAAEESWQGNAAVARRGEFEAEGLYAASNSFPENTMVAVTNLDNGKSVTVTIRKRIDGSAGLFLLLSESAASVLAMRPSEIIRVETRVTGI
ncbi:MAG: SPOR domain-containing protein, partial [Spirochaetaceae bacterium]